MTGAPERKPGRGRSGSGRRRSVYGLDHNFALVGYTDLDKRGMNSPIAGEIAIIDAADPARRTALANSGFVCL